MCIYHRTVHIQTPKYDRSTLLLYSVVCFMNLHRTTLYLVYGSLQQDRKSSGKIRNGQTPTVEMNLLQSKYENHVYELIIFIHIYLVQKALNQRPLRAFSMQTHTYECYTSSFTRTQIQIHRGIRNIRASSIYLPFSVIWYWNWSTFTANMPNKQEGYITLNKHIITITKEY